MSQAFLLSHIRLVARALLGIAAVAALIIVGGGNQTASSAGTYSFGVENSWIRVQNIGQSDAKVDLSYFDEAGKLAGKDSCPSSTCPAMYPGSGWTFFQKDNPTLPSGFQGSAVVSTDQPIAALLAKDITRNGKFAIGGNTIITGPGSHRLYLPLMAKQDGANSDWNGRFVIQNMSDTVAACVTITYLDNFADGEVAWEPYKLPANGSPSNPVQGCPNGGTPIPPRGSLFRSPDTMAVGAKYTGSVRIDLSKNAAGHMPDKQFISATADSWNSGMASFDSYRGFDENELGTEVVLPLVDREVGPSNSYSTRFQIVNKSPANPAQVTIQFDGYDMSSGSPVFVSKKNTLEVKGARLCFQDRDDYANCLGAGDRLPYNFIGTARLTSTQPIAVIVMRSTFMDHTYVDYRALRPQDASTRVLLPNLNKNYGPVAGVGDGWNSWFRIMVADGGTANVTVTYYGLDLPDGKVSYTTFVNREFTVFQYFEDQLPNGFAGTAIIEADRPIVGLANLTTDIFDGDPDLLYNGIPLN